ncbi:S-adenosyl-L-methionine-dependent methyltransferase [Diplogelasinospora grovesii]|uniref:S-adenosyl-L-methionine-dependent methyltransferase n=1 Tax=Diplogelasinospora grovesii TaxID=303347 RepID=A0AAN6N9S6_9PEZI|nr:S-adenosyl-L-methionine-dependent methyltransferase [Diplogelasinospora grovesii]
MATDFKLPAAASEGFKNASAYDAHRPSYPPEAVERLLKQLKIADQPHVNLVELASGTGKLTELLAKRHEDFDIIAVEPHEGMRAQLVAKGLKGVTTLDGHAARMPVEDGWGDACVAAQSFHWFATEDALREIHRVLKPNAVFGMIWNVEDYNKPWSWRATTAWEQKLNDWIRSISTDGHPRFRDEQWKKVFQNQLKFNPLQVLRDSFLTDSLPRFSLPLGEDTVKWTVWLSKEALWSRISTLSHVVALEGAEREAAVKTFDDALSSSDVERNDKGEIAVHGVTYFAWTDRIE